MSLFLAVAKAVLRIRCEFETDSRRGNGDLREPLATADGGLKPCPLRSIPEGA